MADEVTRTKLQNLTPDSRNANQGTERGAAMLETSLRKYGAGRSILLDRAGRVIAGNKTLQQASDIGIDDVVIVHTTGNELVAVQRDDLDLADDKTGARALAYADNRTSEVDLSWDPEVILADMQAGVDVGQFWRQDELDELLAEVMTDEGGGGDTEAAIDKADELAKQYGTKVGQIWRLGEHRLAIGDCTDPAVVEVVMRGERADACITDPPYGMNWNADASRFTGGKFGNEPRGREKDNVINDDKPFDPAPFLDFPVVVLWGMNHFCDKLPPGGVFVWIKKPDDRFGTFLSDCELGWTNTGHGVYAFRHDWGGITRESERGEFLHPTQKPTALMSWAIEKSKAGKIIFDPFVGSGTTIIAAHNLGRIARAVELDPGYAAVCLDRFFRHTNIQPELIS